MRTAQQSRSRGRPPRGSVPAYGPVEAALGFGAFYVFVARATPVVVAVVSNAFSGVTPATVRFALAVVLWLALAANAIEQVRRQVVAYRSDGGGDTAQSVVSTESWLFGYGVLLVVAGLFAWYTFDRAVETGIAIIRLVVTLGDGSVSLSGVVVTMLFFVAFGLAARAADRLVISGVRFAFAD